MSLRVEDVGLCCGSILQADLSTLAEVASAAGFRDLTIWPTLYTAAIEAGLDPPGLRRRLDDLGVRVVELDPICTWVPVEIPDDAMTARFARYDEADFFAMAEVLGSTALNVIRGDDDRSVSDEAMIDGLGALADRAAGHGLRVQLEFLPWSPLATLDHAARIVAGVGRANCGVHVDVWHLVRSGGSVDDLSTLDPALVGAVQLSDLAPEPWDDLFAETSSGRRLPGEGDGSAARAVVALSAAGVDAPVNLEVFSSELLTLAPADAAARLARSVGSL